MSRKYKDQEPVYAVMRADLFLSDIGDLEKVVVVKEVVRDLETAKAEVERLNSLRGEDGKMRYWWQATRLYPAGTSAGTDED